MGPGLAGTARRRRAQAPSEGQGRLTGRPERRTGLGANACNRPGKCLRVASGKRHAGSASARPTAPRLSGPLHTAVAPSTRRGPPLSPPPPRQRRGGRASQRLRSPPAPPQGPHDASGQPLQAAAEPQATAPARPPTSYARPGAAGSAAGQEPRSSWEGVRKNPAGAISGGRGAGRRPPHVPFY